MTRVPNVEHDSGSDADGVLAALAAERGFVPNLYAALANAPRFLADFVQGGATARSHGALPARMKEAAILRISAITDSATMRVSHLPLARAAGLSDAEIDECLSSADPAAPDLRIASRFAAELTARARVSGATWDEAAALLDAAQLTELVYICAFYNLVARVLGGLEIDLDPRYSG